MRTVRAMLLALALATSLGSAVPAHSFCDESEGCSPCPPPQVIIDGKNSRIEWVHC